MRMILALLGGALLFAGSAHADPKTFTDLEAQLSAALAKYDAPAIDKLWDDDLAFVFPDGKLSHKAERLAAQVPPPDTGGPKLVARNDAVDVEYEDSHMAVVVVRSTWRFGDEPPQHFIASHVWVSRPQGWRLLSAQVALLKDKP